MLNFAKTNKRIEEDKKKEADRITGEFLKGYKELCDKYNRVIIATTNQQIIQLDSLPKQNDNTSTDSPIIQHS